MLPADPRLPRGWPCQVRDKAEYKAAFMSDRLHSAFGFDKTDRKDKRAAKMDLDDFLALLVAFNEKGLHFSS